MSNWKKELYNAICKNDFSQFRSILSQSEVLSELPKVKQWNQHEDPVHTASAKGSDVMLAKLLENGADPNAFEVYENGSKFLPIHWAVKNNKISAIVLLVKFGADHDLSGEGKRKIF